MNPQEIFKLVEEGLAEVERELERHSHSNVQLVDRISRYIQDSGGKRIRPALLLLTSQMCGYQGPVVYRLGAVVEMIHAATLVHDDIIDDAKVRRGRPSVNAQWGNEITVLMGDWLYMTAFHLALRERHFKILDILTEVTRKMIEGELIQQELNGSMDVTEEQHLDISMRKTAFLFSACAQIGGILSSVSEQHQEYLDRYGLNIGIAFQMVDDVLDFTSTESTLGKPVVSDLKEDTFYALIWLERDGQIISIDSRPSDALALALRVDCPIFVEEEVLKSSKVSTALSSKSTDEEMRKLLENMNDEDLGRYKM